MDCPLIQSWMRVSKLPHSDYTTYPTSNYRSDNLILEEPKEQNDLIEDANWTFFTDGDESPSLSFLDWADKQTPYDLAEDKSDDYSILVDELVRRRRTQGAYKRSNEALRNIGWEDGETHLLASRMLTKAIVDATRNQDGTYKMKMQIAAFSRYVLLKSPHQIVTHYGEVIKGKDAVSKYLKRLRAKIIEGFEEVGFKRFKKKREKHPWEYPYRELAMKLLDLPEDWLDRTLSDKKLRKLSEMDEKMFKALKKDCPELFYPWARNRIIYHSTSWKRDPEARMWEDVNKKPKHLRFQVPKEKPYAAASWGVDRERWKELPGPDPLYLHHIVKTNLRSIKKWVCQNCTYEQAEQFSRLGLPMGKMIGEDPVPRVNSPQEEAAKEDYSEYITCNRKWEPRELRVGGWYSVERKRSEVTGKFHPVRIDLDPAKSIPNPNYRPWAEVDFGVRGSSPYLDPDEPVEPWHLAVFPEEIKTFQLSYDVKDIFADAANF